MTQKTILQAVKGTTHLEGGRFRKALIKIGTWANPMVPDEKINITRERIEGWIENAKHFYRPGVPVGHATADDLFKNKGFVDPKSLVLDGDTLFGDLIIKNDELADKMREETIADGSIGISVGPHPKTGEITEYLDHYAVSNKPHVSGLDGFAEQAIAAESGVQTVSAYRFESATASNVVKPWGIQLIDTDDDKHKQGDEQMSDELKKELEAERAKVVEMEAAQVKNLKIAEKVVAEKDAKIAELEAVKVELESKKNKGQEAVKSTSAELEVEREKVMQMEAKQKLQDNKVAELESYVKRQELMALESRLGVCANEGKITIAEMKELAEGETGKPALLESMFGMPSPVEECKTMAEFEISRIEKRKPLVELGQIGHQASIKLEGRRYMTRDDIESIKVAKQKDPSKSFIGLMEAGKAAKDQAGAYYWLGDATLTS